MKTTILLAALALAWPAWAQKAAQAEEAAKPQPVAQESAKPAPAKAPRKPATLTRKSKRQEDARHCLEHATNTDIIRCAEEYL